MPKITRALRFEVYFPDVRRADLFGEREEEGRPASKAKRASDGASLYAQLWAMSNDLTRAANQVMTHLWAIKMGALPAPMKAEGKRRPLQSLVYQGLTGSWQPAGKPLYDPQGDRVGSNVLLGAASTIWTRFSTDFRDVAMGKQSLSTFRSLPITVASAAVEVRDDLSVVLTLWPAEKGERRAKRVRVRYRKIDASQRTILRHLTNGTYKTGEARLAWVAPKGRKGRWMLSLSWTGEVEDAKGEAVVGVHLGMINTVSLAFADATTGKVATRSEVVRIPETVTRAWNRVERERRDRLRGGAIENGNARAGRGRDRKLRAVDASAHQLADIVDTALKQVAARVVAAAKCQGASVLALEDLAHWSVAKAMDELPDGTNAQRAKRRRWYLRWHQGALRELIACAATGAGMKVIKVSASNDSRECSKCGVVHKTVGVNDTGLPTGRYSVEGFRCGSCGHVAHADRNAAVNVVQRGLKALALAQVVETG